MDYLFNSSFFIIFAQRLRIMKLLKIIFWIPLIGELIFLFTCLCDNEFVENELSRAFTRGLGIYQGICFAILLVLLGYYDV